MKLATFACLLLPSLSFAADTDWPAATRTSKPWIEWQSWPSLTESQITEATALVKNAGFGGIILHQQTGEDKKPDFLTPEWLTALSVASRAAANQDIGVDWTAFALGVDWKLASSLTTLDQQVEGGTTFKIKFPEGKLEALRAYPENGKPVNLAEKVSKGQLVWKVPAGKWQLLGLFSKNATGKDVLDPFSAASTKSALKRIDQVFAKDAPAAPLRAGFHTSVDSANPVWSSGLLTAFQEKRGYDLRDQLPAFLGIGAADTVTRVRADYRQTLDELYRIHLQLWQDWSAKKKSLTRLQTQDALGNIIDQAAIVDLPEIKIARAVSEDQFPQLLLAPSAAHFSGRPLIAATIHDKDLQLKQTADLLWLAGVNHIVLESSPAPFLTAYMSRCQSYLQAGTPHADLLLYYPEADLWNQPATSDGNGFTKSNFHQTAMALWKSGIGFDLISDNALNTANVQEGKILLKGKSYQALVIPAILTLPEATATRLVDLTKKGLKLGWTSDLPTDVPGFLNAKKRTLNLTRILAELPAQARLTDHDPISLSRALGIRPDTLTEAGVRIVRRNLEDGNVYFLLNPGNTAVDQWLPLSVPCSSAVMLDPSSANHTGLAPTRNILGTLNIHLSLAPGESRILRTYTEKIAEGKAWKE